MSAAVWGPYSAAFFLHHVGVAMRPAAFRADSPLVRHPCPGRAARGQLYPRIVEEISTVLYVPFTQTFFPMYLVGRE
jgi:hypothetical protein